MMQQTLSQAELLAFIEYVRGEAFHIGMTAKCGKKEDAAKMALSLCTQAAKKKREVLGLPEPDPDVDYDPDYHWDGTERLNGEPRREKGESFSDSLDLSALAHEGNKGIL